VSRGWFPTPVLIIIKKMAVQIQVSDETWSMLKDLKKKPSDTFDGIIFRLLEEHYYKNENKP